MTFETGTGFVAPIPPLDALANRVANDVIAKVYANAREAAWDNLDEYVAHQTNDISTLYNQVGSFTKKIVKTLRNLGYDKSGKLL